MSNATQSLAFVLRRKPFREQSLLLDLYTEQQGKITCVAKYSKQQADRLRALFEPMRLLEVRWRGRGEVFTLFDADEVKRFPLKGASLVQATYATEILLRGSLGGQAEPELFELYHTLLNALIKQPNTSLLNQFELAFLDVHGQNLNLETDDVNAQAIDATQQYYFQQQVGVRPASSAAKALGIGISGALLCALRQPDSLTLELRAELRQVLDHMLAQHLQGKTLFARALLV